ncbi:MAG: hypothetical protein HC836_50470 [Richelia sp. RM2_1_2]|nr:hypothetical protein [Richelia sp. RM2_1_2]
MKDFDLNIVRKNIPLRTKIAVKTQFAFIDLLSELGYRQGVWMPEEDKILDRLMELAKEFSIEIQKTIEEHERD